MVLLFNKMCHESSIVLFGCLKDNALSLGQLPLTVGFLE